MRKGMACGLVALAFGFLFVGSVALGQADGKTKNVFAGTWKGNAPPEGSPVKEQTMIVAVKGDTTTVTFLNTLNDGKVETSKISAPTAGGPITSDPPAEPGSASVLKKIDDHTYLLTDTMKGKVVLEQRAVVSPDNKTMTVDQSGVDPSSGKPFKARLVYDRQ